MHKKNHRMNPKLSNKLKLLPKHKQRGSSLLEVLIALLIMAIGLLGLETMQVVSLKNINNSQFRSLATAYASSMAERMRSNRVAVQAGNYDAIAANVSDPSCTAPCTPADIAQQDGYQWNQQIVAGGLPSGQGTVTKSGDLFTIRVAWNEQQRELDSSGSNVVNADFTLSIQL